MRAFLTLILGLGLALAAPASARDAGQQRLGDSQHPAVVDEFGRFDDPDLQSYVDGVARRIIAVTPEAAEPWTLTILDTPVVNAFALPGGYVYVTRGLLALANDEAELAGVLAHEIAHITLGHGERRNDRGVKAGVGLVLGTVVGGLLGGKDGARDVLRHGSRLMMGYMANYSREQEYRADAEGVRLLAGAGYDPAAQADFLAGLAAMTGLQADLAGREYNPGTVEFFDSHPATADRIDRARDLAAETGSAATRRNEEAYLSAIDGLIFGDSRAQGFVRGSRFLHPDLMFAFQVPPGFTILNANRAVTARGPGGSLMVLEGATAWPGALDRFITDEWLPAIARDTRTSGLARLQTTDINGLPAATARVTIETADGPRRAVLAAIRMGDRVYRLTGLAPPGDRDRLRALAEAMQSFRPLSPSEAAALHPWRIRQHRVRPGDSLNLLSATMPMEQGQDRWFRVLNGYAEGQDPQPGDRVKLVAE
jgi:predicted Zn-dependent protease